MWEYLGTSIENAKNSNELLKKDITKKLGFSKPIIIFRDISKQVLVAEIKSPNVKNNNYFVIGGVYSDSLPNEVNGIEILECINKEISSIKNLEKYV